MLNIQHLTKTYKGSGKGVIDLSITLSAGDIYGFIGHNGAGKTTTLKCIAGILDFKDGDILIDGDETTVFCLPGICGHLLTVERIGRVSVKAEEIPLDQVRVPKREYRKKSFSVMSMRLDAVAAGMFNLSRTACAKEISEGNVSLNYRVCMKTDAAVEEGDVISLRGHGKGTVSGLGGNSRKGRQFVEAEILI